MVLQTASIQQEVYSTTRMQSLKNSTITFVVSVKSFLIKLMPAIRLDLVHIKQRVFPGQCFQPCYLNESL